MSDSARIREALVPHPHLLGLYDRTMAALTARTDLGVVASGSLGAGAVDAWSDLDLELLVHEGQRLRPDRTQRGEHRSAAEREAHAGEVSLVTQHESPSERSVPDSAHAQGARSAAPIAVESSGVRGTEYARADAATASEAAAIRHARLKFSKLRFLSIGRFLLETSAGAPPPRTLPGNVTA